MDAISACRGARACPRRWGLAFRRGNRGLSLLELLVGLSIGAILLMLTVPALDRVMAQNRLATSGNQVLMAILAARQSAISHNVRVTICAGNLGAGCHRDWSRQEWLVFVDPDGDGVFDSGERPKLADRLPVDPGLSNSANGPFRNAVVFQPSGAAQTVTGAFAAGRLRICLAEHSGTNATDLVLIGSGRIEPEKRSFDGECPAP